MSDFLKSQTELELPVKLTSSKATIGVVIIKTIFFVVVTNAILSVAKSVSYINPLVLVPALAFFVLRPVFCWPISVVARFDGLECKYLTGHRKLIPWNDIRNVSRRTEGIGEMCSINYRNPWRRVSYVMSFIFRNRTSEWQLEVITDQADLELDGKSLPGYPIYRRKQEAR